MTRKIILWFLVVFWMGVIFYFSSMNGFESARQSKGFLHHTLGSIIDIVNPNMSDVDKELLIEKLDLPVRKAAHASVYFILAIFVFLLLESYNIRNIYFYSLLICFLYACTDEIHQLFVFERSAEVLDVLIDSCGSIMSLLIIKLVKHK